MLTKQFSKSTTSTALIELDSDHLPVLERNSIKRKINWELNKYFLDKEITQPTTKTIEELEMQFTTCTDNIINSVKNY